MNIFQFSINSQLDILPPKLKVIQKSNINPITEVNLRIFSIIVHKASITNFEKLKIIPGTTWCNQSIAPRSRVLTRHERSHPLIPENQISRAHCRQTINIIPPYRTINSATRFTCRWISCAQVSSGGARGPIDFVHVFTFSFGCTTGKP